MAPAKFKRHDPGGDPGVLVARRGRPVAEGGYVDVEGVGNGVLLKPAAAADRHGP